MSARPDADLDRLLVRQRRIQRRRGSARIRSARRDQQGGRDGARPRQRSCGRPSPPGEDARRAHVIRHPRARLNGGSELDAGRAASGSVIGICASTGGPHALATLLGRYPGRLRRPDPRRPAHLGRVLGGPGPLAERHSASTGPTRRGRTASGSRRDSRTRRRRPPTWRGRRPQTRSRVGCRAASTLRRRSCYGALPSTRRAQPSRSS